MGFIKRLGWYLLGLSVGLVFLVIFLKKKSEETGAEFCYLPNCRVLKDMRSKPLVIPQSIQEELTVMQLDSLAVRTFLEDGKVDFSKSDTEAEPCKSYVVLKEINTNTIALTFQNCQQEVTISAASKIH